VDKPALIGDLVRHWLQLANEKQTVCFAANITHSKHIVEQFQAAGIKAEHIDGYMDDEERAPIYKRFEDGETTILSNVAVLREGFDVPACEVMILARPTKSLIAWVQMAGRVLRPYPGKDRAIILDHSGSAVHLGYPTDDLPLELDDGTPKKDGAGKQIEKANPTKCPACSYIKPAKVHVCPSCGLAPERQSNVEVQAGELVKLDRGKKPTSQEKRAFYSELLGYASLHGYKDGWAFHKYIEKFGLEPAWKKVVALPGAAVLNWVKSRQIASAKRKESSHASARP